MEQRSPASRGNVAIRRFTKACEFTLVELLVVTTIPVNNIVSEEAAPNKSLMTNRRCQTALSAQREVGCSVHARPLLSAAVAYLARSAGQGRPAVVDKLPRVVYCFG